MKWISALLAFLAASQLSLAAPAISTAGWSVVAAPRFTLYSQLDAAATKTWAVRLNQFLQATGKAIRANPRTLPPLTIVFFASKDDFWALSPLLKNKNPLQGEVAFSGTHPSGLIAAVAVDQGSDESTQNYLFTPGVEWYLGSRLRYLPKPLVTGLAEVYAAYAVEGNTEIIGRPIRGVTAILMAAADQPLRTAGRLLPIEELLSQRDLSAIENRHSVNLYYAECWGFAHFLLFSREMAGSHAMDRLLRAFGEKLAPKAALAEAFGPAAASLDLKFRNYILGGDFYQIRRPLDPAPAPPEPMAADPGAVAAVLSRVETVAARLPDFAKEYADEAVRLAPSSPAGYEALALCLQAAKQKSAESAACATALRLGSRNGWVWEIRAEDRAQSVTDAGADGRSEQVRVAVNDYENAVKLQPSLEEAFKSIATLIARASHVTEDDGKFLAYGASLYPNDGWIEVGRAQWAQRTGDTKLARQFLDDALAHRDRLSVEETNQALAFREQLGGAS